MPIFRFCTDERVYNAAINVSVLILGFVISQADRDSESISGPCSHNKPVILHQITGEGKQCVYLLIISHLELTDELMTSRVCLARLLCMIRMIPADVHGDVCFAHTYVSALAFVHKCIHKNIVV